MATENFLQLPTVSNAMATDVIAAVQNNVTVQESLSQVLALFSGSVFLTYAGNPNGFVAGTAYQTFVWDTLNESLWICTSTGTTATAVWTMTGVSGTVTPTQGGTGVSNPGAHTIPIAEGSNNFNFLSLTNGQFLIGSTGLDPVPATLTAGTNISIINAAGSVTIAGSGAAGFVWNDTTTTSQSMSSNNGYVADNSSLVTLTLPVSSSFGDVLSIVGKGSGGWTIAQNSSQLIHLGSSTTTTGTGGSLSSSNQYDSINLVCIVANTTWTARGAPQGNLTVV